MKSAGIIHIATHGNQMKKAGLHTYIPGALVFAGRSTTQEDDYEKCLLYAEEIQNMKLRKCRLAVITCCYGGAGDIKAEGVVGIGRALLFAGVKTVVLSFWKILDTESTVEFFERFYISFLKSNKAAYALQDAMSTMIADGKPIDLWSHYYVLGKGN